MLLVLGRPGEVEAEVRAAERGAPPGPLADGSSSVESSAAMVKTSARLIFGDVGAALVGVGVASRTLYAPARDRILVSALATVSHQAGTSVGAATASMTLKFALLLAFGLASTGALDAFFCPAATGALSLLTVYVLASVSVLRLYVLFRHLIPAPAVPYSLPPYLVSGSRSRPPRRSHAGGSAKAPCVAEFADRTAHADHPGERA